MPPASKRVRHWPWTAWPTLSWPPPRPSATARAPWWRSPRHEPPAHPDPRGPGRRPHRPRQHRPARAHQSRAPGLGRGRPGGLVKAVPALAGVDIGIDDSAETPMGRIRMTYTTRTFTAPAAPDTVI